MMLIEEARLMFAGHVKPDPNNKIVVSELKRSSSTLNTLAGKLAWVYAEDGWIILDAKGDVIPFRSIVDVSFGFEVDWPLHKVWVEIEGGNVTNAYCNTAGIAVSTYDHDNRNVGEELAHCSDEYWAHVESNWLVVY